ncbi:CaiB/BaiF CoA transferase family protein [Pollutimonas bauzanensis]|uniref:Crotonobetainyl-CoA:carnitine CoA-transferase CaiB n=1 Tax=Pollutimonas bauzanensis TaxID=658167 RepID=A0A1M5ZX58_9BURK|nr:CoA transferase [Pollutimonas bauzanensis]SHI28736.1 Crotonobetainyl-CoA:carnitine CoA-transferase CaiB [Pollutimonas bauzanensis]
MSSTQPLAGYVVVEIGHSVAAPYAGLVLAELGAEVIKVENPDGGDSARGWGPPFIGDMGPHFSAFNRNKASIAVDLGDPDQRDALKALIADRADVVICNLRAGSADKLGLGSEALTAAKPALVYCELGAFGAGGPLSHKPGYDPLMQAYCGVMSVTGESAERPPVRVGVSMVDMGAGLWSAIGILASLLARKQSGKGCRVETSLFETAVAWVATPMARHLMGGGPQLPQGSGAAGIVPYQAFRTQTGWLVIGAGNDKLFAALCKVMGRPELAADPRFAKNGDRVVNQEELLPIIKAYAAGHESQALSRILDEASIPNAPVQTIAQLAEDDHARQLGLVQKADGRETVGLPIRFDRERPAYRSAAPSLGEHTGRIFAPYLAAAKR